MGVSAFKGRIISARPSVLFAFTACVAFLVALIYLVFFPASYFDLSLVTYFTISSSRLWLIFSAYLLSLAGVYLLEKRKQLRIHPWLLTSHYIFVVLFLLVFFIFSQFNEAFIRELLSSYAATTVVLIYGTVFLVDFVLFSAGIVLLLINIMSVTKERKPRRDR